MKWKEKNQYVKRQHYVPQISIRPFEIEKEKCLVVKLDTLEITEQRTQDILQEIDLYEVKNEFGEYVNRNEIEDSYKVFEDYADKKLKRFVDIMMKDDFQKTYASMIEGKRNTQWATMEAGFRAKKTYIYQMSQLLFENLVMLTMCCLFHLSFALVQ